MGAFLTPDMSEFTTVRFVDEKMDTICVVTPSFKQYVSHEGRKKLLHVMLNTSSCGPVRAALLWYELYSTTLVKINFKLNPYDLFVANKTINNNQNTITWFVDDSITSHVEEQVVRDTVKQIQDNFGSISEVHGQRKKFLGTSLEFLDDGNFE